MDDLARGAPADRAAVLRAAAAERGLPPPYVEKDFWVCWSLRRLFAPPLANGMVFKGGTSLSKVWAAIQRFSEDVDLTLPRTALPGADRIEIDDGQSVSQRKKGKELLDGLLASWCGGSGLNAVRARIEAALGTATGWSIRNSPDSLEFEYPLGLPTDEYGQGYVHRAVLFEFGVVMPTEPAEDHQVQPYSARAGEYQMRDPIVRVHVLAPERTFWEKTTLVHAENNRPAPREADRVSRHYADVAELFRHGIGRRALAQMAMLPLVAREKERYFHTGWAGYADAAQGRLRLVPPPEHERALRRDYERTRELYPRDPLSFDIILERLGELQDTVAHDPLFKAT
jgi:hypothetical protein